MFYKHYVFLEEINNLIKGNLINVGKRRIKRGHQQFQDD